MIDFDFDKECCGCFACADICPKHCITYVNNRHGFFVPKVEKRFCVDCGLCNKVCPVIKPQKKHSNDRKVYSAYNKSSEIRMEGSSGSLFYTLAEDTINMGGVVYGAAFVGKMQLKHISAESLHELKPLMKSKYLQSDVRGIYKQVKYNLGLGRRVLFVGTPCQCNALYKFLGARNYENLLLVDFICHGVPSQDLFDKALKSYEKNHDCVIDSMSFRVKKEDDVHHFSLNIRDNNDEPHRIEGKHTEFPFYYGFKKFICLRESCYQCKFCVKERVSDMTLADFWGLEKIDKTLSLEEFNKGVSMVICNSSKGEVCLHGVYKQLHCKEQIVPDISKINFAYTNSTRKGVYARNFWRDYDKMSYEDLEKRYFTYIPFNKLTFFQKVKVYIIAKFNL